MPRLRRARTVAVWAALVGLLLPAEATASPVQVGGDQVRTALACRGDLRTSPERPILLLHATAYTPETDWGWTWVKALDQRGWAHCTLRFPESGMQDIQTTAEYVVGAIRWMHEQAGTEINLVGHSQGGIVGRWALKYWPDTRAKVDDYVGLSASNHGTEVFRELCAVPVGCSGALWQQVPGSAFLTALNGGGETFSSVDYTEITTLADEIVVPATSGWLAPGPNVTNVHVQSICPSAAVDHFRMPTDYAAWAIALDALTHAGPAKTSRVSRLACLPAWMPGVDPVTAPGDIATTVIDVANAFALASRLPAEPALRCYATSDC